MKFSLHQEDSWNLFAFKMKLMHSWKLCVILMRRISQGLEESPTFSVYDFLFPPLPHVQVNFLRHCLGFLLFFLDLYSNMGHLADWLELLIFAQ